LVPNLETGVFGRRGSMVVDEKATAFLSTVERIMIASSPPCWRSFFMLNQTDGARKEYIKRLKALHKRKTGEELSDARALQVFEQLISLVKVVYQPMPLGKK
jgi:hypothetical protein